MSMSDHLRKIRERVGHELLVLPSAAVALFDDQNRILMGEHADRSIWVLPGGLVEPGELPSDAAVRETWEEMGILVELTGMLGVYGGPHLIVNYSNGDQASYVGTIFRGRIVSGEPKADGSEILQVRYFSRDELDSVTHSKWMNDAKDVLFDTSAPAHFQPSSWKP